MPTPRRPIPVHPLLLSAFPILFLFAHNIGQLPLRILFAPLAISVGAAALVFFLLKIFLKNSEKAALTVSLFLILFFSYGHVYRLLRSPSAGPVLLAAWGALFILGAALLAGTRKDLAAATRLCNISAAVLVSISLVNICGYELVRSFSGLRAQAALEAGRKTGADSAAVTAPDIYYIVVDAYAADDVLKEVYGFDNSGFTDYLEKKGFYVARGSTSNYSRTGLSLASSLNMDYIDAFLRDAGAGSTDVLPLYSITKNNRVFSFLRRRGYTIAALSSGCVESEMDTADVYLRSGWTPGEFQDMLIGTTPVPVILDLLGARDRFDAHRDRILYEFDRLARPGYTRRPFFFFAHLEVPHPPFVFGPGGEKPGTEMIFSIHDGDWLIRKGRLTKAEYLRYYTDQLIFTNKKLKAALDAILSGPGKKPIVILQSDHGPRSGLSWEKPDQTDFRECMSILNAYYLPEGGEAALYEDITPVNTFRVIFDHYFQTEYGLLEDKNFFSGARYPYAFTDVTGRVHADRLRYK